MSVMCSWCHGMNSANDLALSQYCIYCGHRADAPRSDCDCPKCWKPVDGVGEPGMLMAAPHTPGPWIAEVPPADAYTDPDIHLDRDVAFWIAEVRGGGEVLGHVLKKSGGETEPNARLIAAAPEMLKALNDIADVIERGWIPPDDEDFDLWHRVADAYRESAAYHAVRALILNVEHGFVLDNPQTTDVDDARPPAV